MKKVQLFLILGIASLFATGCMKDDDATGGVKSFNSFRIELPSMVSDSKAYVDFNETLSTILYEEGDVVYINHVPFTLSKNNNGDWIASSNETVTAETFYCCYADGTVSNPGGSDTTLYNVLLEGYPSTSSGIVLAGSSNTDVIHATPAFCVLVFKDENNEYESVRVGFDNGKIPMNFTISAADRSISSATKFPKANMTVSSSYLTMKKHPGTSYFFIAIPIQETAGVATKLYFQYEKPSPATPVQRVTSGEVTLQRGHVYVIPSEDMSNYPFDINGAGKYKFSVSGTKTVRFSAGNLQYHPYNVGHGQPKGWIFASNQYEQLNSQNNLNLNSEMRNYMDLFAWATSGMEGITPMPYSNSDVSTDYGENSLLSDLYDWGVNSSIIYFGEAASNVQWRTLTIDEWQYLLSRSGKVGYATITIGGGVNGLVILPDNWVLPNGCTFSVSVNNNYSIDDWTKMERKGAIFLPANGERYRTADMFSIIGELDEDVEEYNTRGFYWSATNNGSDKAKAISFIHSSRSLNNNLDRERQYGLSVRLVTEDGASSAL